MEELIFKRGIPISSHQKIRRICVQKGVVLAVPAIQCSVRHVSPEISNQLTENTSTMVLQQIIEEANLCSSD